jgi:conjugative transfer signal peptidase TraF
VSKWLLVGMFALAAAGEAYHGLANAGLRFNVDSSIPVGAYWFTPGPVAVGDTVQSCLPESLAQYALRQQYLSLGGSCPDGVIPVVKVLAATAGDSIVVADSGVSINGRLWPMSARLAMDSAGRRVRRIPSVPITCPDNFDFLMGENDHSWDSRYWGCVSRSTIAGRWKLIPYTGWATALFTHFQKENR